jgi:hypothetical protein
MSWKPGSLNVVASQRAIQGRRSSEPPPRGPRGLGCAVTGAASSSTKLPWPPLARFRAEGEKAGMLAKRTCHYLAPSPLQVRKRKKRGRKALRGAPILGDKMQPQPAPESSRRRDVSPSTRKVAGAPRRTPVRTVGNGAVIWVPRSPAARIPLWRSVGRGRRGFAAPSSGCAMARAAPPVGPGGTIVASPPSW